MENIKQNSINKDIEEIKRMVLEIKTNMVHEDAFLTPEENSELDDSISRFKEGKTKDFELLKEKL